jgi:hypothetical protein
VPRSSTHLRPTATIRQNPFLKPSNLSLGFPIHSKRYPTTKQESQVPPDKLPVWMEAEKGMVLTGRASFRAQPHPLRIFGPAQILRPRPAEALTQLSLGRGNLVYFLQASRLYLLPKARCRKVTRLSFGCVLGIKELCHEPTKRSSFGWISFVGCARCSTPTTKSSSTVSTSFSFS